MTFLDAIRAVIAKFAEFEGRSGRPEFWWWMLFTALGYAAFGVFSVIPVGIEGGSLGSILTGLWSVATVVPTLAVGVRRLRDAGCTWPNIFWILVPIAGIIVLVIYWAKPTSTAPAA